MALLKGNELVHFIPRDEIEGHEMEDIMNNVLSAFENIANTHVEMSCDQIRAFFLIMMEEPHAYHNKL